MIGRHKPTFLFVLTTWATTAGCGQDLQVTPVRNLERPADLDFACVGRVDQAGAAAVSGLPMRFCHSPEAEDPSHAGTPRPLGTFGFVTNTARASVAVVDLDRSRLVDLDTRNPSFNQVPVGALPEDVAASDDGCVAITANRGSCDLSLIDVPATVESAFGVPATTTQRPRVETVVIRTASGRPLRARPYEVVVLPTGNDLTDPITDANAPRGPLCRADGYLDDSGLPRRAAVTLPGCDLLVVVELPSGRITTSMRFVPGGGVQDAGTEPTCSDECGWDPALGQFPTTPPVFPPAGPGTAPPPPAPPDAAADGPTDVPAGPVGADANGGPTPDVAPPAPDAGAPASDAAAPAGDAPAFDLGAGDLLALATDGGSEADGAAVDPTVPGRVGVAALELAPPSSGLGLFVGAVRSPVIHRFDLTPGGIGIPATGGQVVLSENVPGVDRLRLSVNRYGPGGAGNGQFVGTRGKFLYAIARDGAIRVVDVGTTPPRECDVNIDFSVPPTGAGTADDIEAGCVPVGQASRPRKITATGPGLRLPVTQRPDVAPPVPQDVTFVDVNRVATVLVLGSDGQIYHVALDFPRDDMSAQGIPTHSFRQGAPGESGAGGGDPQATVPPNRSVNNTIVPFPTKVGFTAAVEGPQVESFVPTGRSEFAWASFPRPAEVVPQQVRITWEGELPGTRRRTYEFQLPTGQPGSAGTLGDLGANYCAAGVEVGDAVTLIGCDRDLDCDQRHTRRICHYAAPGAKGVCLTEAFLADESRVQACQTQFASRRRYTVREVTNTHLTLGLKLDEVPRPAILSCTVGDDAICQPDVSHRPNPAIPGDAGFQCLPVEGRPRCVKRCGVPNGAGGFVPDDTRCRAGHVCRDVGEPELGPLCVEAPVLDPACVEEGIPYVIQTADDYLLTSNGLPFLSGRQAASQAVGAACVPPTNRDPRFVNRIPLDAPACVNPPPRPQGYRAEDVINTSPATGPEARNPCLLIGPNGGSLASRVDERQHLKALFENPHMRFVLTNLETYVGDALDLDLLVTGGFSPLVVRPTQSTAIVGLGVRIVTGPMDSPTTRGSSNMEGVPPANYVFVVDQGRTTSLLSRGQLHRINPRPTPSFSGGFIESPLQNSLFPIQ